MIEPHMQAMADALFWVLLTLERTAMHCTVNGHLASAKVLHDIIDSLDNVWTRYDAGYQEFEQQFLHTIECDDE